jgi:CPA1 family monovalent cation:H+ antiporter
VAALLIGWAVGWANLAVRKRVTDPTVNTVISFTVPFVASIPAELVGSSGLVAAVVAGLITGIRAPRDLSPRNRLSDSQNWRTVELILEGTVFLTMGIQIKSIVANVQSDHGGAASAVLIAVGALVLAIVVRAAYVTPLFHILAARARRTVRLQPRIQDFQERMSTPEGKQETLDQLNARGRRASQRALDRFAQRLTRGLANIEYFLREPLGWREGTAVVWAGMRGAVTVAAAQTLPDDTPQRSFLVLVAFAVATMSLAVQGGTIGLLLNLLAPAVDQEVIAEQTTAERTRIMDLLRTSAMTVPKPPRHEGTPTLETFEVAKNHRLAVIAAQRAELLDARDNGTFDADVLAHELANLDASEIAIELRGRTV